MNKFEIENAIIEELKIFMLSIKMCHLTKDFL